MGTFILIVFFFTNKTRMNIMHLIE